MTKLNSTEIHAYNQCIDTKELLLQGSLYQQVYQLLSSRSEVLLVM